MKKINLIILLTLVFSTTLSYAFDCKTDVEFRKAIESLNHESRILTTKFTPKYIKYCDNPKANTAECLKVMKEHQDNLDALEGKLLTSHRGAYCVSILEYEDDRVNCKNRASRLTSHINRLLKKYKKNKCRKNLKGKKKIRKCLKIVNTYRTRKKAATAGAKCSSTLVGLNGYQKVGYSFDKSDCMSSQNAVQFCRGIGKDLQSCVVEDNQIAVKCKAAKQSTPSICMDKSNELSLLAGLTTMCQVSSANYNKYKECLTADAKANRMSLCKYGCTRTPTGSPCKWSNAKKRDYFGCKGFLSLTALNESCRQDASATPTPAPSPTDMDNMTGSIDNWSTLTGNEWPLPTNRQYNQYRIRSGKYRAIRFRTGNQQNIGGLIQHMEDTSTSSATEISISENPGDFNVPPQCFATGKVYSWGINYALNFEAANNDKCTVKGSRKSKCVCILKPNTTYYVNSRWKGATTQPKCSFCSRFLLFNHRPVK